MAEGNAKNAELQEQVALLVAQVEQLTEKLNQNSTNSHLPPSSDGPGAGSRGARPSKKSGSKSKRKRGGQKGHRGSHRQLLPPESVATFVELFPEVCLGCAASLPPKLDPDARRHQQVDLRDHRQHVTEWRRHEGVCDHCGTRTRATYDASVIPSSAFGPCLTAVVALLTGVYHLSRRQAQRLLHELFGIHISLGALSVMERRASEALKTAYDEAKREVEHAAVKHSDATTWLRAGVLTSLWTLACASATVYAIFVDGCRETIRPFFGAQKGILVSDRASVFTFWVMAFRQVCWAHLTRKFISFSERDGPVGTFGRELLDCATLIFEYWHGYRDGVLTREDLATWLQPVRRHFERTLEAAAKADLERLSGSCADILAHSEALWTFVTNEGVDPTNNEAERALRSFVLWRKRSFGSQSDRGERFAERVMTVAETARKQGKAVLRFIVDSVTAHFEGQLQPRLLGAPDMA
ncbi:MAG: IS66 family transposase [Myxococcota bacterium]